MTWGADQSPHLAWVIQITSGRPCRSELKSGSREDPLMALVTRASDKIKWFLLRYARPNQGCQLYNVGISVG